MSAQSVEHSTEPLFPMPPITEASLRVAVRRLDLTEAVTFEQEFHAAWEEAAQTDSTIPMRRFLRRWAIFVALHRVPARSARVHELERVVGSAETAEESRAAADEISLLLADASAEVANL